MNTVATATHATRPSAVIDLEQFADLLADSVIVEKTDMGRALVYKVKHSVTGDLVLINTHGDANMVIYI